MPQFDPNNILDAPLEARVDYLATHVQQLPEARREFAASLCDQYGRRGSLSPRQEPWINRLIEQIARPAPLAAQVGNLAGIRRLFDRALASRLRRPAIVLSCGSDNLRISIAGERSRVPGSINVTSTVRNDAYGRSLWYGRITEDGAFMPSPRINPGECEPVIVRLREFAADPAGVAGEHGRLTGRCCFCNRGLEDERSTTVGYGPVCADHFGLPWGGRAATAELTVEQVEQVENASSPFTGTVLLADLDVPEGPVRPPRQRTRPVTQQHSPAPAASATRIDEMQLGAKGDLE